MHTNIQRLGWTLLIFCAAACSSETPPVAGATAASCDETDPNVEPTTTTTGTKSKPSTQQPTSTRPPTTSSGTSGDDDDPIDGDDEPSDDGDDDTTTPTTSVVAGVDCPDPTNLKPTMTVGGTVRDSDTVWKGIVHINNDVDAFQNSITIEPGTVIIVDKGRQIIMGDLNSETTLKAEGTPDKPIRFCGTSPGAGYWKGISLGLMAPASVLSNVLIDGAGGGKFALGIGVDPVLLDAVRITNSGSDGLHAGTIAEGSDDLTIENSGAYPVVFTGASAVTNFPKQVKFVENTLEVAVVRFANGAGGDLTFHNIGIPYLQEADFEGPGDGGMPKMVFEAGVEYQIAKGRGLVISGDVQVMGTKAKPVLIHGAEAGKGYWNQLRVGSGAAPSSKISYLVVADAGGMDMPAFQFRAPIEIHDVTVKDSASGIFLEAAPADGSTNLNATNNDGYPLQVAVAALTSIPMGSTFKGTAADAMIQVTGPDVPAGTIEDFGIPYYVSGLTFGQMTEIAPGVEFVVSAASRVLTTGKGVITAEGTSSKPIAFRGEKNSNGSWQGILIQTDGSSFKYVQLFNAGMTLNKPADVANCKFSGSPTFGITKPAADMTDYESTNTFSGNTMGSVSM